MPRFLPEPGFTHGSAPRIGVLLVNLGTPAAPTARAVRPYLRQFLSDPRVVEIPRVAWWPILYGIILNTRPPKSAAKYAAIWTPEGSPLRVHTERQAKLLQGYLLQAGHPDIQVEFAMRYGEPAVTGALMRLKERQCTRVLVLPLYPQYAASTTASAFDALADATRHVRNLPELRFVRSFHDHPDYIHALGQRMVEHWREHGLPEKVVMSFHGVPRFALDHGDPYHCECHKTARLLAETLSLKPEQYVLTFQSRFGRTEWLKPYTERTLRELAKQGIHTVDVICPGFVADCLETLEEIAIECKAAFLAAGGGQFRYVPCLNEQPEFIGALRNIATGHMQDWLARSQPAASDLAESAARARKLGVGT